MPAITVAPLLAGTNTLSPNLSRQIDDDKQMAIDDQLSFAHSVA